MCLRLALIILILLALIFILHLKNIFFIIRRVGLMRFIYLMISIRRTRFSFYFTLDVIGAQ